jgi:hypothetical protein
MRTFISPYTTIMPVGCLFHTHMKCCFIEKIEFVEVGLVLLNGESTYKANCFLESLSLHVIFWANWSLQAQNFSLLCKIWTVEHGKSNCELSWQTDLWGLHSFDIVLGHHTVWQPMLLQDISCLSYTCPIATHIPKSVLFGSGTPD